MKDVNAKIMHKDKEYTLVFNLNVMEEIQTEYDSVGAWAKLTSGEQNDGEPNAKAVLYGLTKMINEGIEISNEETGANNKPLTVRQVGRIISEIGLEKAVETLHKTVIASTESKEKNA